MLTLIALLLAGCGVLTASNQTLLLGAAAIRPLATPTVLDAALAEASEVAHAPADLPAPKTPPPPPPPAPPARARAPGAPLKVMFIGDSIATTAADGLAPQAAGFGINLIDDGIQGCGVVQGGPYNYFGSQHDPLPQCESWPSAWQADVTRDDPDLAVVVVGRWELMDRFFEGRWTHIGDPAFDAYLANEVERAIAIVTTQGAKVALFTTPYYRRGLRPDGGLFPEDDPARVDQMNGIFRAVAAKHPGTVSLVDFGGRLSPGGQLAMAIDGIPMRSDGVHLTPQAGAWLAPWLLPQLTTIG
ncbi:MAG TPA: SGNH hydrolase domain-containing protein [Acidimicrobiales bacterium]